MSSVKRIVCLANSWKHGERCIAGIDLDSGKWIRPIYNRYDDGRVPKEVRLVEGREPELLDILSIPLANTGEDFGFEQENLNILPGKWQLLGKATPSEILQYCGHEPEILHNSLKYVTVPFLQSLPLDRRQTLQLIHTINFSVQFHENSYGVRHWKGTLESTTGQVLVEAKITDPVFTSKLDLGYKITGHYLVTVSLSMPWRPSDWEGEDPCWKLIAGVIEIPGSSTSDLIEQTNQEMKRIGWDVEQGRRYLMHKFHKRSRQQLTLDEFRLFLNYLQSLPDQEFDNLPY